MDENISALMDGELNTQDASLMISQLGNTNGLREQWAAYHLIGDAMKQAELAPFDITRRVSARLAVEPPPQAAPFPAFAEQAAGKRRQRPVAFAAAASVAAMVVGGWMSLQAIQSDPRQQNLAGNQPTLSPAAPPPLAAAPSVPQHMGVSAVSAPSSSPSAPAYAPEQIDSYLMAHRQFSPSTAVHGVTSYMRTSTDSRENFAR